MSNETLAKQAAEILVSCKLMVDDLHHHETSAIHIASTYEPTFDVVREMRDLLMKAHWDFNINENECERAIASANAILGENK